MKPVFDKGINEEPLKKSKSILTYRDCCQKAHQNRQSVLTAEQLMRARYSAFARGNINFLEKTHDPKTLSIQDLAYSREWANKSQWLGLEIHRTQDGSEACQRGTVEFTAFFDLGNGVESHHEISLFIRLKNLWYYTAQAIR